MPHPRSSRQRYRAFVEDYRQRRLDDSSGDSKPPAGKPSGDARRKRRQYLREFVRWLRPQGYAVAALIVLALIAAGLDMASPRSCAISSTAYCSIRASIGRRVSAC